MDKLTHYFPEDIRLIRWIEDKMHLAKYNLSLSGLEEPDFASMGVDTSLESMRREARDAGAYFKEILADLYGYERNEVFLTTGGSEAIFLISLLARAEGMTVFTGLPEYEPIFNVPQNMGNPVESYPFSSLPSRISAKSGNKAAFLSNPNNPIGNLHSGEFLSEIRDSVGKTGFTYVDEAFLEFVMQEKPKSVYDGMPDLMINGSLTKFYGFSGMRVGWIVADAEKLKKLNVIRTITGTRNPSYPLWIAGQCLLNRHRFQERSRKIVEPNLKILSSIVESHEGIGWQVPHHAPFGLVRYSRKIDSEVLCNIALEKYGLFLDPGDFFGEPGSFRVCFTSRPDVFAESMEVFTRFIEREL